MQKVTFARDYHHRRDPLTTVRYRKDQAYTVSNEVEEAARAAGALVEKRNGPGHRAAAGNTDPAEEPA